MLLPLRLRLLACLCALLLAGACQGDGLLASLGEGDGDGTDPDAAAADPTPDKPATANGDEDAPLDRPGENPLIDGAGPIVLRRNLGGGDREIRPVSPEEAGWKEKLELARQYADSGYDDEALSLIEASLSAGMKDPWSGRFKTLRDTIRMRQTQEQLLRIEVRPTRDYLLFGEGVEFEVRILNVSRSRVVLQAPGPRHRAVSPSALSLELVRRDWDIFGSFLSRRWGRTIFLHEDKRDIVIAPGATHRVRARIPAEDLGGALRGFRVLEIGGVLRPTRTRIGDVERALRVPLRGARVVLLPRNYEPLAAAPRESFETALENEAAEHLLISTWFLGPEQDGEAHRLLRQYLLLEDLRFQRPVLATLGLLAHRGAGRPLAPLAEPLLEALASPAVSDARARVLMQALALLSGKRLGPKPALWLDWWRREKVRSPTVVDPVVREK